MNRSYLIYDGPSQLEPDVGVICTITLHSSNEKTGDMAQVAFMLRDMPPYEAVNKGLDAPICGDCVLRGGNGCYVLTYQGPLAVWKSWQRGDVPWANVGHSVNAGRTTALELAILLRNREVRIGSYGDPSAVPIWIIRWLVEHSLSHTGYTHMWKSRPDLAQYCMASVHTQEEREEAKALGFRTFRTTTGQQTDLFRTEGYGAKEAHCPASEEMGKKLRCIDCMHCDGQQRGLKGDVVTYIHGAPATRRKAISACVSLEM